MALMLCHKSRIVEGVEVPCAGYVIVVGCESIGLRIASFRGDVNPDEYVSDTPLYKTFREMMLANGVNPPRRNRFLPVGRRNGGQDG